MTGQPALEVDAPEPWWSVPLDTEPALLGLAVAEAYAGVPPATLGAAVVAVTRAAEAVRAPTADATAAFALWALLDRPGPGVRAFAVLRAAPVPADVTTDDCVALVVGDREHHVEPLDTASGPATVVVTRTPDGTESRVVLWPRPAAGLVLLLSTSSDDPDLADHVAALARAVTGA